MAEGLSKSQLVSVSAGIVLFTLSALSSMEDVVRIDALKVLDLLLAYIPEELCRGWNGSAEVSSGAGEDLLMGQGKEGEDKGTGAKVVEALLGMLKIRSAGLQKAQGAFTTQAAGSDLSPTVRLVPVSAPILELTDSLTGPSRGSYHPLDVPPRFALSLLRLAYRHLHLFLPRFDSLVPLYLFPHSPILRLFPRLLHLLRLGLYLLRPRRRDHRRKWLGTPYLRSD